MKHLRALRVRLHAGSAILLLAAMLALPVGVSAQQPLARVAIPVVTRAPDTGTAFNAVVKPLPRGFVEEEFFVEGNTSVGPYRTRILVRRPEKRRDFNGAVIVEWFNVSFNFDIDIE